MFSPSSLRTNFVRGAIIAACLGATPALAKEVLAPDPAAAAQMSIIDAKDMVLRAMGWWESDGAGDHYQTVALITPEHMQEIWLLQSGARAQPNPCAYETYAPRAIFQPQPLLDGWRKGETWWSVLSGAGGGGKGGVGGCWAFPLRALSRADAISAMNAMLRLKNSTYDERVAAFATDKDQFKAVADAYRAASPKPAISEDVHRLQVQAEAALRDRHLAEAAAYYLDAVKAAPWWPEGHFNDALVLGEMKYYAEAIEQMQRYLALTPDAPDARAAQDKIYEWEPQAKRLADIGEAAVQAPKKGK
jgi:tetratricopeptide (TPR) repeat protein